MINFDALEAAVAAQPDIVTSVEAMIQDLRTQVLAELENDAEAQAKVDAAFQTVLENNARLAEAVQATPTPTP